MASGRGLVRSAGSAKSKEGDKCNQHGPWRHYAKPAVCAFGMELRTLKALVRPEGEKGGYSPNPLNLLNPAERKLLLIGCRRLDLTVFFDGRNHATHCEVRNLLEATKSLLRVATPGNATHSGWYSRNKLTQTTANATKPISTLHTKLQLRTQCRRRAGNCTQRNSDTTLRPQLDASRTGDNFASRASRR